MPARGEGVDRRRFLSSAGLIAGVAAAGVATGVGVEQIATAGKPAAANTPDAGPLLVPVAFEGRHQPGVVDRAPAYLRFLAFSLVDGTGAGSKGSVRSSLVAVSQVARSVMGGAWPAGADGIATGLRPAHLTVSIGLGAGAVAAAGASVPSALAPLPSFSTDRLDRSRSGGDLGIQICGEDPMTVAAAARAMVRAVAGHARLAWSQGGFLRSAGGALDPAATPRNLMGQLDGTDNPSGAQQTLAVWVPDGVGAEWMQGGTYLVCRRIRMLLDAWEATPVARQEAVIGRRKDNGAPLTGGSEHSVPDFTKQQAGQLVIPADAHIRLTHPANNAGATMLRRGYSFDDGIDPSGHADTGLFFQAFQTDPHQVFVPIQRKLAAHDALNDFIRHEGSALFALPPGASAGGFVGERLF